MDDIKYDLIQRYFDKEITREEESFLFSMLAADTEAREYFKDLSSLQSEINKTKAPYPENLDSKILSTVLEKKEKPAILYGYKQYFGYAAAVVMLVLSLMFYFRMENQQTRLESAMTQVKYQEKMIELLYNSVPTTEVKSVLENQVIVTSQKL